MIFGTFSEFTFFLLKMLYFQFFESNRNLNHCYFRKQVYITVPEVMLNNIEVIYF